MVRPASLKAEGAPGALTGIHPLRFLICTPDSKKSERSEGRSLRSVPPLLIRDQNWFPES